MELTRPAKAIGALVDAGALSADPVPWILASEEPFAVWFTLTAVLGEEPDSPRVTAARQASLEHPAVKALIESVSGDLRRPRAGHHSPSFLPSRLNLLADLGVRLGDDERLDEVVRGLAGRLNPAGRRPARRAGASAAAPDPGSPECDINATLEVLLRYGLHSEPAVMRAARRFEASATATPQGFGWCCTPGRRSLLGPRRMLDACPQITLEGLRALSLIPAELEATHRRTDKVAATPLESWRRRTDERPYEFGHGYQFKTVKWPGFWYDALAVVDTVGRFPGAWSGAAPAENRRSLAELAACLIAYNLGPEAKVTPDRVYRGYESFSFGLKTGPSPFATARVLAALVRVAELSSDIAAVDVEALPSSRGADVRAVPPTAAAPAQPPLACPAPLIRSYDSARVLPRVFGRHHLDLFWEPQSIESVTADLVGLPAAYPAAPHLALAARLPQFDPASLDSALDEHRSLVRIRCMRGQLYAVRRDFVPVVHAASSRQVVRYARDFARRQGVEPAAYEHAAGRVLETVQAGPLSLRELRSRIDAPVDLGAVITLMSAERLLLQCGGEGGRFSRRYRYTSFADALPDVDLDTYTEDEARPLLLRAFVRGFGPVTHEDAAWWTGMDLKRVRRSFEALEDELVEVTFDRGERRWLMHAADEEELEKATFLESPNVAVLPANDPLVVGYRDRARFVDDMARPFVFDASGNSAPVILVDGRIAAVWDVIRASESEKAGMLVFPVAPLAHGASGRLEERLTRAAGVLGERDVHVRFVSGMRPLTERPVGAFAHPLRGPSVRVGHRGSLCPRASRRERHAR